MSKKILQKVVDELKKDSPDLPYIRGILETLIEIDNDKVVYHTGSPLFPISSSTPGAETGFKVDEINTNEDKEYERRMAGGPIGTIG